MITKRKADFHFSETQVQEINPRKKLHSEYDGKLIIKFHKNINLNALEENVYLILNSIKNRCF